MDNDKSQENEIIDTSNSEELDPLVAASLDYDMRMIEKKMAESKVKIEQVDIADIGNEGTDHGFKPNEEWDQFSKEVFAALRRIH